MIQLRSLALLLFAGLPLHAGVVQTLSDRLEGKVLLEKDAVTIDGKKVPWADVLYLLPDTKPAAVRSQRVYLRNGELWTVEILSLADGKLTVRSDLLGIKKLDVDLVAGLEFTAPSAADGERKIGVLYRVKGEAVPGKLLALKADKATVDSAVGELDLPRDGLSSYRFAPVKSVVQPEQDEVALADGSLFHGKLTLEAEGAKFEHPTPGSIRLTADIVRSVVRHPARVLDLVELPPRSVQSTQVVAAEKPALEPFRGVNGLSSPMPTFVKGLLIEPKTVVVYKLPGKDGARGKLRTFLTAPAGARGDVRLTIRAADKVLLERDLGPLSKADMISVDVQAGQELHIVVDFGERLRFPCAAVLGDPHVVWDGP